MKPIPAVWEPQKASHLVVRTVLQPRRAKGGSVYAAIQSRHPIRSAYKLDNQNEHTRRD